MSALSAALEAFVAGPGDLAAARALAGTPEPELLALVAVLAGARQRTHLEALGEAGLGKESKKAARAAAYKLKSAGVAGEVKKSSAFDLSAFVELDRVAIVGPPALDGQRWILAATVPGAPGFELDLKAGEPARVDSAEELGRGRLRKLFEQGNPGRSHLAHADLAVRVIDRLEVELAAQVGGLPASFAHAARWRDAMVGHGANPNKVDARAALAAGGAVAAPAEQAVNDLFEDLRLGYLVPPEAIVKGLEDALNDLLHADEVVDEEAFRQQCEARCDDAADAWLAQAGGAARVAGWLEDDADLIYARGDADAARTLLGLADATRTHVGPGRELAAMARAVRAIIDLNVAWAHRQDHMEGRAHHGHDHGHGHAEHVHLEDDGA